MARSRNQQERIAALPGGVLVCTKRQDPRQSSNQRHFGLTPLGASAHFDAVNQAADGCHGIVTRCLIREKARKFADFLSVEICIVRMKPYHRRDRVEGDLRLQGAPRAKWSSTGKSRCAVFSSA